MSTIIVALVVASLAIFQKELILVFQFLFMMVRGCFRSPRALFSPARANWLAFEIWEEQVAAGLARSFRDVEEEILVTFPARRHKDSVKARGRFQFHTDRFLENPVRYYKDVVIALRLAKEMANLHQQALLTHASKRVDPDKPDALGTLNGLSGKELAAPIGRFTELVEVSMPVLRMLRQVEFLVLSGINFYQARAKSAESTLNIGVKLTTV